MQADAAPEQRVEQVEEKVEEKSETKTEQEPEQKIAEAPNPEVALAPEPPKPEPEPVPTEMQTPAPATTAPQVPKIEEAASRPRPCRPRSTSATSTRSRPGRSRWSACWSATSAIRPPRRRATRSGTAQLAFSLDRQGKVTATRIVKSSGSAALDQETLELVRRAQPFPAPPAAMAGAQIDLTVPIRFNMH